MSWPALENLFLQETQPDRYATMIRKPDAFTRYGKGQQVPRIQSSPSNVICWALLRCPEIAQFYETPLFRVLTFEGNRDSAIQLACHWWLTGRLSSKIVEVSLMEIQVIFHQMAGTLPYSTNDDMERFTRVGHPDALSALLLELKVTTSPDHEKACLRWCEEWFTRWRDEHPSLHEANELLAKLVSYSFPELRTLTEGRA